MTMRAQPETIDRTSQLASHGLLAAALAATGLASLTGCGSAPSCDKVVSHVAKLREPAFRSERECILRSCSATAQRSWPARP